MTVPPPRAARSYASPRTVVFWRWRVSEGPPLLVAAPFAEAVRDGLMRCALALDGTHLLPDCLHGAGSPAPDHPHAFYIAEDADGDGRIDHLLVSAAGGLDSRGLTLCATLARVVLERRHYALQTVRIGDRAECRGGPFGPARVWASRTPYTTPNRALARGRVRLRYGLEEQLVEELQRRGLPLPHRVEAFETLRDRRQTWRVGDFKPPTGGTRASMADRLSCFLRLEFAQPLFGPLSLGHACHFGLGHFAPAE